MHSTQSVMQTARTQPCRCIQLADLHIWHPTYSTAVRRSRPKQSSSQARRRRERREKTRNKGRCLTCSIRSTWRVMQAVMPNSSSTSSEASLLMELVLTMLLRLALERLYISCRAEGLPGSSMPPLLLLVGGGGDLEVLPCTCFHLLNTEGLQKVL